MANGSVAVGCIREVGRLSVYPVVNSTDAASPIARPKERSRAVVTPDMHCLKYTLYAVSDFVEPKDSVASSNPFGTVFITSSIPRIIIGIINNVTVSIPANSEDLIPKYNITVNPKAP